MVIQWQWRGKIIRIRAPHSFKSTMIMHKNTNHLSICNFPLCQRERISEATGEVGGDLLSHWIRKTKRKIWKRKVVAAICRSFCIPRPQPPLPNRLTQSHYPYLSPSLSLSVARSLLVAIGLKETKPICMKRKHTQESGKK